MSAEQIKPAWRIAGSSIVILLVLMLVFYQQTVLYLISLWDQIRTGTYAHGYLVLAISAYLIINKRHILSSIQPCPEYRAVVAVVVASMLWMVSALVNVEMLQAVALLLLLLSLVWAVLGNRVTWVLVFPILFLGFAIPVWFPISPILQTLTADVVFWMVRILGIPALRVQDMIVLPAGTLTIEEACSGLHYLLAALTLGTLYAYINYSSFRARLTVVLIAAGSAILANIVRVFIVVYLGYSTEMQSPLVKHHLMLGWYLFGGLVILLLLLDTYLYRRRSSVESKDSAMQSRSKIIESAVTEPVACKTGLAYYFMFIIGLGLVLSIAPAVVYQASHQLAASSAVPVLPAGANGWSKTVAGNDGWMPVYHGAVNQKQSYQKDHNKVVLYMGYYPRQKQGVELINDLNHINNHAVWSVFYTRAHLRSMGDRQVLEQLLKRGVNNQRLVWYWYNIAGYVTTNKYEAKMLQVLGLLTGKTWAYVIAVSTPVEGNIDSSRQVLKDFILSIKHR